MGGGECPDFQFYSSNKVNTKDSSISPVLVKFCACAKAHVYTHNVMCSKCDVREKATFTNFILIIACIHWFCIRGQTC